MRLENKLLKINNVYINCKLQKMMGVREISEKGKDEGNIAAKTTPPVGCWPSPTGAQSAVYFGGKGEKVK